MKTVKNLVYKMSVALKFTYFDPIFPDNLQSNSRIMSITGYDTNCIMYDCICIVYIDFSSEKEKLFKKISSE